LLSYPLKSENTQELIFIFFETKEPIKFEKTMELW